MKNFLLNAIAYFLVLSLAVAKPAWGQGFATTATPWALPAGGYTSANHDYSYYTLAHTTGITASSDHTWTTLDLNGDAKPDLVVLTEYNGTYNEPFGTGSTGRYWKVYLNTGAGYATTATNWALPTGGYIATGTGHLFSFNALEYASTAYTGNQSWAVRDLNGDARPDLVVLTEGTGIYNDVLSTGTTRYWRVYLNTGTGFSTTATTWALPAGGYVNSGHAYSFNTLDNNTFTQRWSVVDLNNDAKPDLVLLTENDYVFGNNTSTTDRYWKVYLNTGAGFSTTATTWALPAGGHISPSGGIGATAKALSFDYLAYSDGRFVGDQSWAMRDITGDGRPDLVVLTEETSTYDEPYGSGINRYWKVYPNTGLGFASAAVTWALPAGGLIDFSTGHAYSFNALTGNGSPLIGNQRWAFLDLNGDAKPDLVVLAEGNGTYNEPYGTGSNRYWKVYLNTGAGFSTTATTWALPVGGYTTSSHTFSFLDLAYTSTSSLGSQTWSVLDINGDAKPDLIVLTERGTTYDEPYGTGTSRYWKAYLNATTVVTAAALGTAVPVVSLYPNPTTDQVLVESGQALLGQPYTVTDYLGRPVLQGKLTAAKQAISLGSLSSGLYLIQVGGQLPQRLRVVKR